MRMKLQQERNVRNVLGMALGIGLGICLVAPAVSAEIYSWRTEDGGYAYTDDRDQIPARYASQVQVVGSRKLESYERYTIQDAAAGQAYADRLSARLERLRAMNAADATPAAHTVRAGAPQNTLALATGDARAPLLQVPAGNGQGPILVEPVIAKESGDSRTRRMTVIRQDGETLAVIKGARHTFNISEDIHDEDELEAGAALD
jgi:hypothetical protein